MIQPSRALLCGLALLFAVGAKADQVTWYLQGVTFQDGSTASGSFVFDADTNSFSSIDIKTTTGSIRDGAHYVLPNTSVDSVPFFLLFVTSNASDLTGTPVLAAELAFEMTNAGGTIGLSTSSKTGHFSEDSCIDTICSGPQSPIRNVTGGSITTAPGFTLLQWFFFSS
jgi:hypothetical protein